MTLGITLQVVQAHDPSVKNQLKMNRRVDVNRHASVQSQILDPDREQVLPQVRLALVEESVPKLVLRQYVMT